MTTPPWLAIARQYEGVKEFPGLKANPIIISFASKMANWVREAVKSDETPWCGTFVGFCFREWLSATILPKNPLSALAWASWGESASEPALGVVLIFKRPGGGHVGFYEAEDAACFHVRGGNQGNSVSVTRIQKNRLVAMRWPKGYPFRPDMRYWVDAGGKPVSQNEA